MTQSADNPVYEYTMSLIIIKQAQYLENGATLSNGQAVGLVCAVFYVPSNTV